MKKNTLSFGARLKEAVRKALVSLKRRPQIIPMLGLVAAFVEYSFNLTTISNTTAKIQGPQMGLCGFVTMLFSILAFICFLNAFPKRQRANIPMVVILFVMMALVIGADILYNMRIMTALTRAENRLDPTPEILSAYSILSVHMILVGAAAALTAILPLIRRLVSKINTSIDVEGNGKLDVIDISGE